MITTCLFSLSVQYELRLITMAMPEWWELYYSVLLCVLTLFSSYQGFYTLSKRQKDRQTGGTSMFLLATFFTTAGNSSEAFLPLAISCKTQQTKNWLYQPNLSNRTWSGWVEHSCLLSGLHIEAMERWLHQKCCFTRLPAAKPGNLINMDDQVTLRSF